MRLAAGRVDVTARLLRLVLGFGISSVLTPSVVSHPAGHVACVLGVLMWPRVLWLASAVRALALPSRAAASIVSRTAGLMPRVLSVLMRPRVRCGSRLAVLDAASLCADASCDSPSRWPRASRARCADVAARDLALARGCDGVHVPHPYCPLLRQGGEPSQRGPPEPSQRGPPTTMVWLRRLPCCVSPRSQISAVVVCPHRVIARVPSRPTPSTAGALVWAGRRCHQLRSTAGCRMCVQYACRSVPAHVPRTARHPACVCDVCARLPPRPSPPSLA